MLTGSEQQQADLEKHIVNVKSVNVFQSEGKLNFSNITTNKLLEKQQLPGSSYYCGSALVPIIDGALLTEEWEREAVRDHGGGRGVRLFEVISR